MPLARPLLLGLACLVPGLWSCGSEDPETPPAAPGAAAASTTAEGPAPDARRVQDTLSPSKHIAMLVPADTAVYVELASIGAFDALMGKLARASETLGRSFDELGRTLHRNLPGDERYLLADRPVGIAISLPLDREPALTLVLPVKDVVLYRRSLEIAPGAPQPVFDGTYLAISQHQLYERPREPVAIVLGNAATKPKAPPPIMARADVARLDRRFGSQLRLALAALATGEDTAALRIPGDPLLVSFVQELADPLLYALAVGRELELSGGIEDGHLRLEGTLRARDAGVLAAWTSSATPDLAPLARSLVASDTFSFVGGADPSVLAEGLADALTDDEGHRDRLARLLASFTDLFGPVCALSASLETGESHFALHVRGDGRENFAGNLASTFELFSRSGLGVAVQSKSVTTIEEVEVQDLVLRFDASSMSALTGEKGTELGALQARLDGVANALFGAETVRVRIASFGELGLIAVGNDDAWFRRTLLWGREGRDLAPPDVRAALEHLGSAPSAAVVRLDMARWVQDHSDWSEQWRALFEPVRNLGTPGATAMHAVDPQPLTVHLGAEGDTLRIGVSLGLDTIGNARAARR